MDNNRALKNCLELQSQTTRLFEGKSFTRICKHERGCHPPRRPIPRHFARSFQADFTSPDYNSEDFQSELFRLHSQLLTESWLVPFHPLSDMLKFSGYSCLIGGPIGLSTKNNFPFGIKVSPSFIREQSSYGTRTSRRKRHLQKRCYDDGLWFSSKHP